MFWERILLIFTDSTRRVKADSPSLPEQIDTVPMSTIRNFTLMQVGCLGICYGITWAGIGGISFPIFIMLLVRLPTIANEHSQLCTCTVNSRLRKFSYPQVPYRYFVLARLYKKEYLRILDPLEDDHYVFESKSRNYIHAADPSKSESTDMELENASKIS